VDNSPVGYLNALNYDVAFYSRRTIPIVSQKDPDLPQYLIAWRALFDALPATKRSRFEIVMVSNPTSLDGTDQMLLLRLRPGSPAPKPSEDYIQATFNPVSSREERDLGVKFLRQALSSNLSSRLHQSRQDVGRCAAQAGVAYLRDLRLVEIHLD
jgi:hypothetical protein